MEVDVRMTKPKTLFDHLKAITQTQDPEYWETLSDADKKSWSNFMTNRFLSMNPEWTEMVDRLQYVTQTLEPRDMYKLYISVLPKSKTFLRYVSADKAEKHQDWLVELVARHYECSQENALDYLDILFASDEGRATILYVCELYAIDKKSVRSLKIKTEK